MQSFVLVCFLLLFLSFISTTTLLVRTIKLWVINYVKFNLSRSNFSSSPKTVEGMENIFSGCNLSGSGIEMSKSSNWISDRSLSLRSWFSSRSGSSVRGLGWWSWWMWPRNSSNGTGNTMVEFFSAAIEFSVWRYRSWRAAGESAITSDASRSACEARCSPSAAITWKFKLKISLTADERSKEETDVNWIQKWIFFEQKSGRNDLSAHFDSIPSPFQAGTLIYFIKNRKVF